MSWLLTHRLSGFARRIVERMDSPVGKVKDICPNYRSISEYAHLVNFKDILKYELSPQVYESCHRVLDSYEGFTEENQRFILQALLSGNHPQVVFDACGISSKRMKRWIQLGEAGVEPFAGFLTECLKAQGYAGIGAMKVALGDDPDKSKQARWWLGVMYPQIYGPRKEITETSTTTMIQVNNFNELSTNERAQRLSRGGFRPEDVIDV